MHQRFSYVSLCDFVSLKDYLATGNTEIANHTNLAKGLKGSLKTKSIKTSQEIEEHKMVPLPIAYCRKEGHIESTCPKAFASSQADCGKGAQLMTDHVTAISLPSLLFYYNRLLTTPT